MACNKYKNCHYKSAVQFYSNNVQPFLTTNIITNPVALDIGSKVTDTGMSIDEGTNSLTIENTGLYRFSANATILGAVAGDAYVAMTLDGVVMPETLKRVSLTTADYTNVSLETVRQLSTCCGISNHIIGYIVYSDATASGSVTALSGNAIKLA